MAFLFIAFAVAMAAGTFIESYYNTDTARIWVYNAWWFEAIMVFFVINFCGNIGKHQLHKKENWASLLLHLSFILIMIGAFVTRYISHEGMMPIREGATENIFYSDKTYLNVMVDGMYNGEMKRKAIEKPMLFSQAVNNNFSINDKFDQTPYTIKYKNFVMNAQESIKEDSNGIWYIKLVEAGEGSRHEHFLKEGEVQNIHNILFTFNKPTSGAINIIKEGDNYNIQSAFGGEFMKMADQSKGNVYKDSLQTLNLRALYTLAGSQFVFPEPAIKGVKDYTSNNDWKASRTGDALTLEIESNGIKKELTLLGAKGKMGAPQSVKIGDLDYTIMYGSKVYELPFEIKLNDFIAARYPGTINSYSAFESKVTLTDNKQSFDARIFMNNILDHKGYRFFQAQFDQDEKGTILSVNHDFWGTWITYIGYFLLYFAMLAILFNKNTRFADIKRKLERVKLKKSKMLTVLLFFISFSAFSQHEHKQPTLQESEAYIAKHMPSKDHSSLFGKLVIQDAGGRMKPLNTFSSELLRKVSKSDTHKGYNSDQVFLSMTQSPSAWFQVPFIYLKKGNDSLRNIIGVEKEAKYASFINFFDKDGNYKLASYLDDAYNVAVPNQFQKDFKEIDKRIILLNSALSGRMLKIFPVPDDENNKWVSALELNEYQETELVNLNKVMFAYMKTLDEAVQNNNYKLANDIVTGLEKFQIKYGSKVRPSEQQIKSEILYNKFDIFKTLYYLYMLTGVLMLAFCIFQIFNSKKFISKTITVLHYLIRFFFVLHTLGLATRWYISGHAPWSDAYESMIYVAWATMLFSLIFDRKSKLTLAAGTFVASIILMIAHWNWMDPSIANLQPVLNSYWLMIHVSVIVASYGPFTLAMILGLVSLILMLLTTEKNKYLMKLNIKEITYINEMAITIGLVMLTIGNFLGGQWANESWGRYWGWDPKETWALISIMIYAFVIHMRFVPFFRGLFVYNFSSIIAFYSIMMTYFGVNFYLTGLHSYASGDKVVTPVFVYISLAVVLVLGYFANRKYKKYLKTL